MPTGASKPSEAASTAERTNATPSAARDTAEPMDEDALLQEALAMSMAAEEATPEQGSAAVEPTAAAGGDASMFDAYDEELQNAIKMSMAEVQPGDEGRKADGTVGSGATQKCLVPFNLIKGSRESISIILQAIHLRMRVSLWVVMSPMCNLKTRTVLLKSSPCMSSSH